MEPSQKVFKFHTLFLAFTTIVSVVCRGEVPRPRGVSLSRASLYSSNRNFLCFDNSKSVPFTQVNDDYCDCLDGSDEPGTSACPNGIFYCTNAGHKPLNLASSRVNDGVCDCCDGSDEYARQTVTCPNICQQLGKHAREEAERQAMLLKAGKQLKAELSQKGIQLKQEKKTQLTDLQRQKEEADRVKTEKLKLKDEIEREENQVLDVYRKLEEEEKKRKAEAQALKAREEAIDNFKKYDSNQDNRVDISELQTRTSFDKDKNGEVSEEEAKYFLNNQESVDLETFITDAWPNIKPYLLMIPGSRYYRPPVTIAPQERQVPEETTTTEADDLQDNEEEEEEEYHEEDNNEENEEEEEPPPEKQAEEPISITYDEETQKIVDQATSARSEFAEAERNLRDIENEIKSIEDYLEKDFGPEEEFASLQGQCFEYTDHEYVYKLCPFDSTSQQAKSGGSETRLGSWGKWNGPESHLYESMLYDKGQNCWNGPQRSTAVKVSCGIESKVTSVSEPNRCEYFFEFVTAAACRDVVGEGDDDLHDEL